MYLSVDQSINIMPIEDMSNHTGSIDNILIRSWFRKKPLEHLPCYANKK